MVPVRALSDGAYRCDLGDGLVVRWATAGDADRLTQFFSLVYRNAPDESPLSLPAAFARDLLSGYHPLIGPTDFAVVEDTHTGAIAATSCLLSQVWEYAGIPVAVGRPECVATDPAYRGRGLIRAAFDLIHARSAARGHLVQGITGIPYFYRQFGYEYALDLRGGPNVAFSAIPDLPARAAEPALLRAPTPQELPLVRALYDRERASALVSTRIEEPYWRWALEGMSPDSGAGWRPQLIVSSTGHPVGYLLLGRRRWGSVVSVKGLAVEAGVSLATVLPAVLRALRAAAPTLVAGPDAPPADSIAFELGRTHPIYDALDAVLARPLVYAPPDAWYVRVPDLPAFIHHIAPVLETRLATAGLEGYSGDMRLDFYRDGVSVTFAEGRLTVAARWRPAPWGTVGQPAQGGFPPLVFLQLLFGYRSLGELRHAFPDVWADEATTRLLQALFPPHPSRVIPLD